MEAANLFLQISCFLLWITFAVAQWGQRNAERVLLNDVTTLTLHQGKMTSARRSHAVPQLACVGGTAGCSAFEPQVVQCYNRGSDGIDVQWECKTDMDNDFRFGKIEVICEGYDSSNDPYILKGSCALEYSLDLTKEGAQHRKPHYSSKQSPYSTSQKSHETVRTPWFVSTLILIGVVWFVYKMYRSCVAQPQFSTTSSDYPSDPRPQGFSGSGSGSYGRGPPPPYPGDSSSFPGESCGNTRTANAPRTGGGGPGFWSGMGAGGALGYLFGRRNTGYGGGMFGGGGYAPRATYGSAPSYGSSYSGGSSSMGGSSGSREASGFGGTRRR